MASVGNTGAEVPLTMPKKSFVKKKAFAAYCRKQVVENGLINHPDGGWRKADSTKAMDTMQQQGYHIGRR